MSTSSAKTESNAKLTINRTGSTLLTAIAIGLLVLFTWRYGSMSSAPVLFPEKGNSSVDTTGMEGNRSEPLPNRSVKLLNASYDPTREFYQAFNSAFADHWKNETGQTVTIDQSHGGSGKQARAVIDGSGADVVTLALAHDIDQIAAKAGLMPADWQKRLPYHSSPYTSTIVFLVRAGNPKNIRDWSDLVKGDVEVITANPKTGGGARWNYLAAWGFALHRELGSFEPLNLPNEAERVASAQKTAEGFVRELYRRVPVLDSAARGSTITFIQREIGDVLLTWENEAFLAVEESGRGKVEIVVPSLSILAEPPVAVIDENAKKHGVLTVAQAYLDYLYSIEGQRLAAVNFYRPVDEDGLDQRLLERFKKLERFELSDVFGDWANAQRTHFDDGGVFDRIYKPDGR